MFLPALAGVSIGDKLEASFDGLLDSLVGLIPGLAAAAVTLLAYAAVWWVARRVIDRLSKGRDADQTTFAFVRLALRALILTLGGVAALGQLGVDTAALVASLGIVGLTIGFAARDALSNLISGILIFWDRPFVLGDMVEIEGHYGRIDHITLRSTRVVTPDGKMLAVPNSTIISSIVTSYTNFPHIRLDIEFTVGVDEDIGRVRALALAVVTADTEFMSEPAPAVTVTALNDYNVGLRLQAWLGDEKSHLSKRPQVTEALYETLRSAGVDMPFETLALAPLTLVSPPSDAPAVGAAATPGVAAGGAR